MPWRELKNPAHNKAARELFSLITFPNPEKATNSLRIISRIESWDCPEQFKCRKT
jgi:hypothetical protein